MSTLRKRRASSRSSRASASSPCSSPGCSRGDDSGGSGGCHREDRRGQPRHHRHDASPSASRRPLTGATAGPGTCTVDGITRLLRREERRGRHRVRRRQDPHGRDQGLRRRVRPAEGAGELPPDGLGQRLRDDVGPRHADQPGVARSGDRRGRAAGARPDRRPDLHRPRREPVAARLRADLPERRSGVRRAARQRRAKTTRSRSCTRTTTTARATSRASRGAIEGADNIEIVKELTYEATDTSVDAQLTELAASGADVFFNAMSITPLVISSLQKTAGARLDCPAGSCRRTRRAPTAILEPGGAAAFPGIYTVSFAKSAASPTFAETRRGSTFLRDRGVRRTRRACPAFPHCCGAGSLRRDSRAGLREDERADPRELHGGAAQRSATSRPRSCSPGTTIDTTEDGQPAVSAVGAEVQRQGLRERGDVRRLI